MGSDACSSTVEREFSNRDTHPIRAKIAQTQDARAVSHDHYMYVDVRPIRNCCVHVALQGVSSDSRTRESHLYQPSHERVDARLLRACAPARSKFRQQREKESSAPAKS